MRRRTVLQILTAATCTLAIPAISRPAAERTLRLIPHADLANFDPIWNVAYIARNAGFLIWDTLYGVDANLNPQRQMVEAEDLSPDGLTWTFRLRPGLVFHDGEPVRASDAVASINRWAARDPMGGTLKSIEQELRPTDDRTFRWILRRPYPKLLLALGKASTPCCFIMPERIARTDASRQISEWIGSGPTRFLHDEWVPGAHAGFERWPRYAPRDEPASLLAGGKRIQFDRTDWTIVPDPATAAAALQNNEADWWERVDPDLMGLLRRNRQLEIQVQDPLGFVGLLFLNHLYPPFDDQRARRAVLTAINQSDYMRAFVGVDDSQWKPMPGFFTPGSPLYTETGGEVLKGAGGLEEARRLLAGSRYAGERVVVASAQDLPYNKAWGELTASLLPRIGFKVDHQVMDWGSLISRRTKRTPPAQGGWHVYHTSISGTDSIDPSNKFLQANGEQSINGWAKDDATQSLIDAWFNASTPVEERRIVDRLNAAALETVVYGPLGAYLLHSAWRSSLTGVSKGPMPVFWGVAKGA